MSSSLMVRGVRGATTATGNTTPEIREAVAELIRAMISRNTIAMEDVASVFFNVTADLDAEYTARLARLEFDWDNVPMLGGQEVAVASGPPLCIRVLFLWNTTKSQSEISHVYLNGATSLRNL